MRSVLSALLVFSLPIAAFAHGGGGHAGGSSHSASSSAKGSGGKTGGSGNSSGSARTGSKASSGSVHVRGYFRKDGTYVRSYDRSAPGQASPLSGGHTPSNATSPRFTESLRPVFGHDVLDQPETRVLVLLDGSLQRTTGAPVVKGRTVVFHDQQNHLYSVPTSTVDLAATQEANGSIEKSQAARQVFMVQSGFPQGRPGAVIDYLVPLECGGADEPSNMRWERVGEAEDQEAEAVCPPRVVAPH